MGTIARHGRIPGRSGADAGRGRRDRAQLRASWSSSSDGAEVGELLAQFREGYDAAAETQVTVLKDMKEKLGLTRDALETTKAAYETTESTFGTSIGEFLGEINSPIGKDVVR